MKQTNVNIPLGIPEVRVLQTTANERGEILITIESTKNGTRCRKCGKWITKLHGLDEWVTIRHLPAFGRRTYLRYHPKRYQCQDCEAIQPRRKFWSGTRVTVRTVLPMTIISCCN